MTNNRKRLSRIFKLRYHSSNCRVSIHLFFGFYLFFYLPQTTLMINSNPQHIYSWVYYTWFLFVADALCDALPPTLLAQMAFLSSHSHYQALLNLTRMRTLSYAHTHTQAFTHTQFFLIGWLEVFYLVSPPHPSPHYEWISFSLSWPSLCLFQFVVMRSRCLSICLFL